MARPAILAVGDDRPVLGVVERDLRQKYGGDQRIGCAGSGAAALQAVPWLQEQAVPWLQEVVVEAYLVDRVQGGLGVGASSQQHLAGIRALLAPARGA